MKALLALALVLIPSPVAPATIQQTVVDPQAIVQVICFVSPTSLSMGTAFRIGPSLMLSVNHVTDEPHCTIGNKPVTVKYKSPHSDFSMLAGDPGPSLKIDCGGFIEGRKYIAIGYARGLPYETSVELRATGSTSDGFAILTGVVTVIPGQSGGPIIDAETGAVVGTTNVYDFTKGWSGSVPLSSTPLCQGKNA